MNASLWTLSRIWLAIVSVCLSTLAALDTPQQHATVRAAFASTLAVSRSPDDLPPPPDLNAWLQAAHARIAELQAAIDAASNEQTQLVASMAQIASAVNELRGRIIALEGVHDEDRLALLDLISELEARIVALEAGSDSGGGSPDNDDQPGASITQPGNVIANALALTPAGQQLLEQLGPAGSTVVLLTPHTIDPDSDFALNIDTLTQRINDTAPDDPDMAPLFLIDLEGPYYDALLSNNAAGERDRCIKLFTDTLDLVRELRPTAPRMVYGLPNSAARWSAFNWQTLAPVFQRVEYITVQSYPGALTKDAWLAKIDSNAQLSKAVGSSASADAPLPLIALLTERDRDGKLIAPADFAEACNRLNAHNITRAMLWQGKRTDAELQALDPIPADLTPDQWREAVQLCYLCAMAKAFAPGSAAAQTCSTTLPGSSGSGGSPDEPRVARAVNTSFFDPWSGEPAVANVMKQSRWWTEKDNWQNSIARNSGGGPSRTPARCAVWHGMQGFYPKGDYVLRWDGSGDVRLEGDAINIIAAPSGGRIAFTVSNPTDTGVHVIVNSGSPGNFRLTLASQENEPNAPHALMVAQLRGDGVTLLRFMNWMQTNKTPPGRWSDRPRMSSYDWGTSGGVPVEAMVALCNAAHCDPWFTIPHTADADYITNFAQYVDANLDPSLTPWYERSNEVWNGGFPQHAFYRAGAEWGAFIPSYRNAAVQLFDIVIAVHGENGCMRVVGTQHDLETPGPLETTTNWLSDQLLTAAVRARATHLAFAPYFANSTHATDAQLATVDAIIAWMNASIQRSLDLSRTHINSAIAAGVIPCCYESGPHHFPRSDSNQTARLIAARKDPRFGEACSNHRDGVHALGITTIAEYSYVRRHFAGMIDALGDSKPRWQTWRNN